MLTQLYFVLDMVYRLSEYGYIPYDEEFDENYGKILDEVAAGITLK